MLQEHYSFLNFELVQAVVMLKYMPFSQNVFLRGRGGYGVTLRNSFNYLEEPFRLWGVGGVHPAQPPPYLLDCKKDQVEQSSLKYVCVFHGSPFLP